MKKSVGIWIRVSTDRQVKEESPEHHERRARQYAEVKDWQVATVYNLAGVSGKSVMEHPEAKRMFEDVKAGKISGLIFSKLARLARNTRELLDISEYFEEYKADLISLDESIDTSTPAGRFFYTLISAVSQWEREEIASRVKASIKVRAEMGKPLGGTAPFGYAWVERRLVINEEEAPIRREIFTLFLKYGRYQTVAKELNRRGLRTRRGVKFRDATVRHLLEDPTAKGKHRANYTTMEGNKVVLKPESEWIWREVPAIVSEEVWEEANRIIKANSKRRRQAKRGKHLFSGKVICHCGKKMYVPSNLKVSKYVCFKCRNKIVASDLERIFEEELRSFSLSPQLIARQLREGDRAVKEKEELLSSLSGQRKELEKEADGLFKLYLDGHLSPETFGERHRPIEERLEGLREQIPSLQAELDYLQIEALSSQEVAQMTSDLTEHYATLPFEEKRSIIELILLSVTVGLGEVSFDLAYLPRFQSSAVKDPTNPGAFTMSTAMSGSGR